MVEKIDNLYEDLLKFHHPLRSRLREHREEIFFPDREVPIRETSQPSGQEKYKNN